MNDRQEENEVSYVSSQKQGKARRQANANISLHPTSYFPSYEHFALFNFQTLHLVRNDVERGEAPFSQ